MRRNFLFDRFDQLRGSRSGIDPCSADTGIWRSGRHGKPLGGPVWGCRLERHGRQKTITLAGDGFHIPRYRGGVAQRVANLADGGIEIVIKVDESLRAPKALAHFRARHDGRGPFQKHDEDLKRL